MEGRFIAVLETVGRITSKTHSVKLKAVSYDRRIYFSRHMPDSDWFKNAMANPKVTIRYNGNTYSGLAKHVKDESLSTRISRLKYPGEERANEKREVMEVTLCE